MYGINDDEGAKNIALNSNQNIRLESKPSGMKSGPFSPSSDKKSENKTVLSHNGSATGILSQPTNTDEYASVAELKQKIADLKAELELSPRQFEDKLLHKLREEIMLSKQKMQAQL